MKGTIWYFAYGSNMDAERMKSRVGGWSERVPGLLKGWCLKFNKVSSNDAKEGFANIEYCPTSTVEGILYAITEAELCRLDEHEGFPYHYERHQIKVERRDTVTIVHAVTYVARGDRVRDDLRPTCEYLNHLLSGAEHLSEKYVRALQAEETLD